MVTLLVGMVFVALLGLEWRRGWRTVRVATVLLALVVLELAQPNLYAVMRGALGLPPAARISSAPNSDGSTRSLSEYDSGVYTMYRRALGATRAKAAARDIALGALAWLAVSPALRGARRGPAADAGERPALNPAGADGSDRTGPHAPAV